MSARTIARRAAFVLGVGALLSAGPAQAQTCSRASADATRCVFMLSHPQVFAVEAQAPGPAGARSPGPLTVMINDAPCGLRRLPLPGAPRAGCRVRLPAGVSTISAFQTGRAAAAAPITVTMRPSGRLASLPREVQALRPRRNGA